MSLICIGDSLTAGYGISKKDCWVSKLNENNFNFINKGVNGDTSIGILSRFFSDVIANNPEKCIIMCGTNDIIMNKSVSTIIDNLNLMVKDLLSSKIVPIILSPPKIFKDLAIKYWSSNINYDLVNLKLNQLNEDLKIFCKKNNVLLISLFDLIPLNSIYYTDGIHLSYESNEVIYTKIKNRLAL
ncbi:GDSL-type esterase/lipase family protein [Clostridium tarantellae]|uniref:Acyl-CoA thioesterase n=1 Tax=Clostridium tarantellae TaxID=39493 RepID=A0A6I1MTI9_9CLOT|nr:GDSL-type esterase/lipase family protein [Clostridium tarantellae]MPQ44191.1 acyl-CoA thioesterase [Clostridium tarantellae]